MRTIHLLAGCGVVALIVVAVSKTDALGLTTYEQPRYDVIQRFDDVEVRTYAPALVAEVEVAGTSGEARDEAFRILAGFIFGNNRARTKIAMTAPVITAPQRQKIEMTAPVFTDEANEKTVMKFFMPRKFSLDTIPEPVDSRIKLRVEPARRYVALRFSGTWSNDNFSKKRTRLENVVAEQGLRTTGNPIYAMYNAPWTVPFMRRNEILLRIAEG